MFRRGDFIIEKMSTGSRQRVERKAPQTSHRNDVNPRTRWRCSPPAQPTDNTRSPLEPTKRHPRNLQLPLPLWLYTLHNRVSSPLFQEQTEGKEQCIAVECNCCYCEQNATIPVQPMAKDADFTQGLEGRMQYYTGIKKNPHWFCRQLREHPAASAREGYR
jgi:hypothetical protein